MARASGCSLSPFPALADCLLRGEVTLRVVSPWAIKAAVDYVFVGNPAPAWLRSAAARLGAGLQIESRLALLFAIVGLGLAAHMGISSYSSCTRASSRRSVSE